MQQMGGDEVVRIFGQLALGQRRDKMMDPVGGQEQQQQSADQFGCPVEALADDPDLEDTIQPVLRFEHFSTFPAVWLVGRVSDAGCREWR
jgi:hypothetical protein